MFVRLARNRAPGKKLTSAREQHTIPHKKGQASPHTHTAVPGVFCQASVWESRCPRGISHFVQSIKPRLQCWISRRGWPPLIVAGATDCAVLLIGANVTTIVLMYIGLLSRRANREVRRGGGQLHTKISSNEMSFRFRLVLMRLVLV